MKLKPRGHEDPEINLISLIDVVLMLVIFFMLSSTFVDEGRLRVRLPSTTGVPTGAQRTEPMVLAVTQQGGYLLNNRELINSSPDTLRAALIKETGTDRSVRITIRADAHATHQAVITAMDVVGRLGFTEVNIATVKDESAGRQ